MKSKLLKFLSIAAVVGCSFLFANANTAEAFGECYAATCGTTGAAKCIAKYPSYAAFSKANPNCASAFTLRCTKNCAFDAENCPSATSQCASADEPAATETCENDPSGCGSTSKCLKAFRGGTDITQGCKDEIKASQLCTYKSNKATCANL